MRGKLRRLDRHLWMAWVLVVATVVTFIVFMQP
jgi:hypothetical protein